MFDRATPSASQTAFIGCRPWEQRARARDVFFDRRRAPEPPSGSRPPSSSCRAGAASRAAGFARRGNREAGTTSSSDPAAVSAPCAASRRQLNTWFGATPCRRATKLTVTPGSYVSATIATFSAAAQRRRRSGPCRTSLFPLFPVIDTTLLLPLSQGGGRVRSIKGLVQVGDRFVRTACTATNQNIDTTSS